MKNSIIGHLDMDAFFAAIEERGNPRFKGVPLVIGADPKNGNGRGVVSTANYKAREYGIHSAMPISKAWQASQEAVSNGNPEAVFLPVNSKRYSEISKEIMEIIRKHTDHIQQTSIDEAYIDFSFLGSYKKVEKVVKKIKKDIYAQQKLTCSMGIGPNKLIAKIASDQNKPDGITIITPKEVESFIAPMPVRKIPGVGPKTEAILRSKGIETVRDLQEQDPVDLVNNFGKAGEDLYRKSRGISNSKIEEAKEAKSIGEQATFEKDTLDAGFLIDEVLHISKKVWNKFQKAKFEKYKTVVVTVRFEDFKTANRSTTFKEANSSWHAMEKASLQLFLPFLDERENPNKNKIRLVGVRIEKLE